MANQSLPSVSVVIPAFNEAGYIEACLRSLSKQTVSPLEIVVVDNNSTDETAKLAIQFPLVRVITEKKQGIVHARNAGFNAAKGDVIARCDADSILPRTWIRHLSEAFAKRSISAITGPCYFYDLPSQVRHLKNSLRHSHTLVYFKGSKLMLGHEALFGSNMAISREIWKKISHDVCLDETKMHEDTDLSVHIAEAGGIIEFDPKLLAGMSMRRAKSWTSIPELISYLGRWTNTKPSHSRRDKS